MLSFLVAIKTSKPEIYSILRNSLTYEEITSLIENLKQNIDLKDHLCRWTLANLEAELIRNNLDEGERNNILESLTTISGDETLPKEEKNYAEQVSKFIKEFELGQSYSQSIQFISSRLDVIVELQA